MEERRKECVQGAVNSQRIHELEKRHNDHVADSNKVREELFKKLDRPSWFAAWSCRQINITSEGNTTTDWECNDTIQRTENITQRLSLLNKKIDNKVAAKDAAIAERARDNDRNDERISVLTAEIAALRAEKTNIKNAGAQD
jgi:hypothetical protein